jgi:hypothetical protein
VNVCVSLAVQQAATLSIPLETPSEARRGRDEKSFDQYREDYVPAPRITADDLANNRRSLNRHLQHTLLLLVKTKAGWGLPTVPLGKDETLRAVCVALWETSRLGAGVRETEGQGSM